MGGVCLNAEENGQIAEFDVVSDARDAGNTASKPQSGHGFSKTPPSAIFFAVPGFIWEIPV
jgi:hypothetical protein